MVMPDQNIGIDGPVQRLFNTGEMLFEEGLQGKEMFLIQEGKVGIFKNTPEGKVPLSVAGPGGVLGEQSLFGNHARSATAVAVEPTRVLIIHQKELQHITETIPPWLFAMLKKIVTTLHTVRQSSDHSPLRDPERSIVQLLLLLLRHAESGSEDRLRVGLAGMLEDGATIGRLKEQELLTILDSLGKRGLIKRHTGQDGRETWIESVDREALKLYEEYLQLKGRGERFKEADIASETVATLSNIAYVAQKSGQETPDGTSLYKSALVEDLADQSDHASLERSLQELNKRGFIVVLPLEDDTLIIFQKERLVRIKKIKEWLPKFEMAVEAV
ncbi:MAG: cyclic nucleotide-binding domain-containing protein [Chitinispirillaceae bacterium]|nr:cyclic nucleotide-binding domain-containing protein [Chitinispirillaceae bacterium]